MIQRLLSAMLGVVDALPDRVQKWLFGREPGRRTVGVLWVVIALAVGVAAAATLSIVALNIEIRSGSSTFMKYTLMVVTSTWTPVVVLVIASRTILVFGPRVMGHHTADITGVSVKTVKRLAQEARSAESATRAIIPSDFSVEEAKQEIDDALTTGTHRDIEKSREGVEGTASQDETPGVDDGETGFQWVGGENGVETRDNDGENASTASSGAEAVKLWMLDTQAALSWDDLLFHAVVPGAVVTFLVLVTLKIWLHPVAYAAVFSAGVVVGTLNLARIRYQRLRRLDNLRSEGGVAPQSWVAALVKRVETPEMTVYVGWVGGRRYASVDRDEFVHVVATRALEYAAGESQTPAFAERYADYVAQYRPLYHDLKDEERERVVKALVSKTPSDGIVPRAVLLDEVISRESRVIPVEKSYGHEPELVLDAYEDIVPTALSEDVVDGVTATRRRDTPLPHGDGELYAAFDGAFTNVSDKYDIDVDETRASALPPLEPRVIDE